MTMNIHDPNAAETALNTDAQPASDGGPDPNDLAHTGIVIVDHGSRRAASNQMLLDFVQRFREQSQYPIVQAAHMELADPTIQNAVDACVQQGATRVMVCPYFLLPGKHWDQDIPQLTREAVSKHPGLSYLVTAPIGLHPMMTQVIQSRLDYCVSHIAGQADECESCSGSGRCKMQQVQ